MSANQTPAQDKPWEKTACIICALNCGLEVQTEGRNIIRIRADKAPLCHKVICAKKRSA